MIKTILAQLRTRDLSASEPWFEVLFDRPADARPMDGLIEWHSGDGAGLQLFVNADDAGHGALTLIVTGLPMLHARLADAGLNPGPLEAATAVDLVQLHDPDGNLVVLAEPRPRS